MGEMILVCGENSSGKSLFAEKLVSRTKGKRYYIATLQPAGEIDHARIEKHRRQRESLGFETLELPFGFGGVDFENDCVVLLEDVANLLGNLIFGRQQGITQAMEEIKALKNKCRILFLVSIYGLSGEGYEGETLSYVNQLNEINSLLFEGCDAVVKMEKGKALLKKGEIDFADKSLFDSPVNI